MSTTLKPTTKMRTLAMLSVCLLASGASTPRTTQSVLKDTRVELKVKPIKVENPRDALIEALIQVESTGNDSAYNSKEDAVGCLQIRPIMVREVNRVLKLQGSDKRYKLKDRWSREKSIEMFNIIADYHSSDESHEVIARRWNGGGRGEQKTATIGYWNKVKSKLK